MRTGRVARVGWGRAVTTGLILAAVLAGCGDDGAAARLSWCTRHQAEVARAALALGLMQPGQRYEDWKYGEGEYRRACQDAYERPPSEAPTAP